METLVADHDALVPREAAAPVPRQTRRAPLYQQAAPAWTEGVRTRQQCFDLLPEKVRETAVQRAGYTIEWWATDLRGDLRMVVFGGQALVVLAPAAADPGKTAYRVETMHLDEASRRKGRIQEAAARQSAVSAQAAPPTEADPRLRPFRQFLRMLPPRAQDLMQEPFLHGEGSLDSDHLIYLTRAADSSSPATVELWGYVTDRRVLTFCAGKGFGYRDGAGVASWDLTCWRVNTARPATGQRPAVTR